MPSLRARRMPVSGQSLHWCRRHPSNAGRGRSFRAAGSGWQWRMAQPGRPWKWPGNAAYMSGICFISAKQLMPPMEGPTRARSCSIPGFAAPVARWRQYPGSTRSGKRKRYCLPVLGLMLAGPVEPLQLPSELTQMTKFRSVSIGLPGPIMGSHQPSSGFFSLLAAWALGDSPVRISTAFERSVQRAPGFICHVDARNLPAAGETERFLDMQVPRGTFLRRAGFIEVTGSW